MNLTLGTINNILLATYTVCLPIILSWIRDIRKDKKKSHELLTDSIETIKRLSDKIDLNEAMNSRYRIIRAADEIRNGYELSDDNLEQIGEDIDIYNLYCQNHPKYKNHKGQKSMNLIMDYEKKVMEGSIRNEN